MDAESFKKQFLPYERKLFRIAWVLLRNQQDAEDVVQDTFYKLWCRRDELAALREPEAFCVVLVKNACYDVLKSARKRTVGDDVQGLNMPGERSAMGEIEARSELDHLEKLMDTLPKQQAEVLRLRHWSDCSMEEIEQITGLSAGNVRVLLSRARKSLRDRYDEA